MENGNATQSCIHSYIPNHISLEDLDVSSLCYVLLHSGKLSSNEQRLVSFIETCGRKLTDALSMSTLPDIDWFELRKTILGRLFSDTACVPVSEELNRKRNRSGDDPVADDMQRSYNIGCSYNEDRLTAQKYMTSMLKSFRSLHISTFETRQKINKLTMHVTFEKFLLKNTEHMKGRTRVCWQIETKDNWKVKEIIAKINNAKELISEGQKVQIVEVAIGSINITTLVPNEILYAPNQISDSSIRQFLKKVVEVGEIDTRKLAKITVVTKIQPISLSGVSIAVNMMSMTNTQGIGIHCIVDKRIERNRRRNNEPYNDFAICDGMFIDCIIDKRLERNCSSIVNWTSTHGQPKRSRSALLEIHKHRLNFFQIKQHFMQNFKASILDSDDSLTCRYLLANNIFKDDVGKLLSALQFAIEMQSVKCAKAIAWKITQFFAKSAFTDFINVWPGFVCLCKMKSEQKMPQRAVFCSTEVVLVVEMRTNADCSEEPEFFHGIRIIYKNKPGFSEEAHSVEQEIDKIKAHENELVGKTKGITDQKAKEHFSQFSKLCLISSTPLKSRNFKTNQRMFSRKHCIQLYCRAKGIIPVGETHFPSSIGSIDTDVLEGYPEFLVHDIKIGSGIRTETSMGTLGGFVKNLGKIYFLTCAHVVLNREVVQSKANRRKIHENTTEVYLMQKDTFSQDDIQCGQLTHFAFPPDEAEGTSIDAALIELNLQNVKINPDAVVGMESLSFLGLKSPYLNDNFLDYQKIGTASEINVISAGAISSVQKQEAKIKLDGQVNAEFELLINSVQKFVEVNDGDFNDPVHIKIALDKVGDNERESPRTCQLLNQISLRKLSFSPGDSGSCIYVKTQTGRHGCIGMAVSSHPKGGCVITPIKPILSYFNII